MTSFSSLYNDDGYNNNGRIESDRSPDNARIVGGRSHIMHYTIRYYVMTYKL